MKEFDSRSELNNYYYHLFGMLTDSRQFLSKKLEKQLEKDLLEDYNSSVKVMQYNEKFLLRMKFKQMYLERKSMKKEYRKYKKKFMFELSKMEPNVVPIYDKTPISIKQGVLPVLEYTSNIEGNISWDMYELEVGINQYSWTFEPVDKERYSVVHGLSTVQVLSRAVSNKQ